MKIPSNIISYIHGISKGFVDENLSEEAMFFDDIWEAYEVELKKWITKSSKRWRFKGSKIKHPKFISFTGKTQPLDLDAPKIIDLLVNSIAQITLLKDHFTLEKIKETIYSCGDKLSDTLKRQAIEFFAPILLEDLHKAEVGQKGLEEKIEYVMYTDKNRKGILLTKTQYLENKKRCETQPTDYKFIIDEVDYTCFFKGENVVESGRDRPGKPAWSAFIYLLLLEKEPGDVVKYEDVFKNVYPGKKYYSDPHYKSVEKWISMFRLFLDDGLQWFLIGQVKSEFVFQEILQFDYCIFRRIKHTS